MTFWGMWQHILLKVAEIVKENSYSLAKERRTVYWKLTPVFKISHLKIVH